MTDQTREQRMKEILGRTKIIFIQDTIDKINQMNLIFKQWEQQEISAESLIESIHLHVHAMKGLALTLSYHQIDRLCQEIIALILQREGREDLFWTKPEIADFHQMIVSLQRLVEEAAIDAPAVD